MARDGTRAVVVRGYMRPHGLRAVELPGTVTLARGARVEAIPPGSVLAVLKHGSVTPEQVTNESLQEGDMVLVSKDGAAFLTLFDGSTIKTTFSTRW